MTLLPLKFLPLISSVLLRLNKWDGTRIERIERIYTDFFVISRILQTTKSFKVDITFNSQIKNPS